jgi:homeobox-leucine zipper protein
MNLMLDLVVLQRANSNQSDMLILQESFTDASGSYVVYAPVDIAAMNEVLNGTEPDYVALLPSGFAILPDGPPPSATQGAEDPTGGGGSLLTVAFQILVNPVPTAKLSPGSVDYVNSLIASTVQRIKAAVCKDTASNPQ